MASFFSVLVTVLGSVKTKGYRLITNSGVQLFLFILTILILTLIYYKINIFNGNPIECDVPTFQELPKRSRCRIPCYVSDLEEFLNADSEKYKHLKKESQINCNQCLAFEGYSPSMVEKMSKKTAKDISTCTTHCLISGLETNTNIDKQLRSICDHMCGECVKTHGLRDIMSHEYPKK